MDDESGKLVIEVSPSVMETFARFLAEDEDGLSRSEYAAHVFRRGLSEIERTMKAATKRKENEIVGKARKQFDEYCALHPDIVRDPVAYIETQVRFGLVGDSALLRGVLAQMKPKVEQKPEAKKVG